jgi:hypothetical protein
MSSEFVKELHSIIGFLEEEKTVDEKLHEAAELQKESIETINREKKIIGETEQVYDATQ